MLTTAHFATARIWKQPKYSSTEKWIKEMWYIHTREYYSAIERNEIVPFAETWMDLEMLIQSEVRKINITLTHMWNPEKWYRWTYLQNRNRDRHREQTQGHRGGSKGGMDGKPGRTYIHYCVLNRELMRNPLCSTGGSPHCHVATKEEGKPTAYMDSCACIAGSLCYTAEISTWPASCVKVKKQQLELDMEQQTVPNQERRTPRLYTVTLLI